MNYTPGRPVRPRPSSQKSSGIQNEANSKALASGGGGLGDTRTVIISRKSFSMNQKKKEEQVEVNNRSLEVAKVIDNNVICVSCTKEFPILGDEYYGAEVECPDCGAEFLIPTKKELLYNTAVLPNIENVSQNNIAEENLNYQIQEQQNTTPSPLTVEEENEDELKYNIEEDIQQSPSIDTPLNDIPAVDENINLTNPEKNYVVEETNAPTKQKTKFRTKSKISSGIQKQQITFIKQEVKPSLAPDFIAQEIDNEKIYCMKEGKSSSGAASGIILILLATIAGCVPYFLVEGKKDISLILIPAITGVVCLIIYIIIAAKRKISHSLVITDKRIFSQVNNKNLQIHLSE